MLSRIATSSTAASKAVVSTATRAFSAAPAHESLYSPERIEPQQAPSLLEIGTRTIYDSDHDQYRTSCRNFYETKCKPFHKEWEKNGEVPRELWTDAGANGMLAVTVPEEYGGMGLDILYSSINWQEQSYSFCTGPGWALHSEIVAPYLVNYGTEELKQQYLPKMVSGECITAIAMTEPGAGSDLQAMRTNAVKDGDDYIINGSKTFITNGWLSDMVIICAKTDPALGAKGISLFAVDTKTPGFVKGSKLKKIGMHAQDTAELFFEDMRVPKSALLGEEGKGFIYLMKELPQERLLIGDMGISAAEACYEVTRKYVNERKAFGSSLSKLQTIRHKLAEIKTECVIGRTFTDKCLQLHAAGKLDGGTASMNKYAMTDLQCKVADDCVQMHGGWGFMKDYDVANAYCDGRVQRIYGGANEIMKELIARSI
jgi:long-chain-acyl-CoA dehydrogenase